MKRILSLCFWVILTNVTFGQGFTVQNFQADIYISEAGYFDVVETYDLNFTQYKHGIYRDIQTRYDLITYDNKNEVREIKIRQISVEDHMYESSSLFEQKVTGNAQIKIGDPDKTIIGAQRYEISYRVYNAFLYEPEATRFYWNVKPTNWYPNFNDVAFNIHFPDGARVSDTDVFIYAGFVGWNIESDQFETSLQNNTLTVKSKEGFVSIYGESVTVLINFEPGVITEAEPWWPFWSKNGWMLIIGAIVLGFYLLWSKHGKDKHVTTTTTYYPPDGIDPAMVGFLINDIEDTSDLISLIPYWGAQGYLKMEEIEKKGWLSSDDTRITKLKELPQNAPDYQKKLFNGLFSHGSNKAVLVSALKDSFYTTMNQAKSLLKKSAQRYYEPKSRAIRKIVAFVLFFLTVGLAVAFLYFYNWQAAVAMVICGIVLALLNIFMIKKNTKGNAIFGEIKGFKEFIKTAEQNKLKMLISESPIYFESTMGYALTFGYFNRWAKKFDALNVKPPDWYHYSGGSHSHGMQGFSKSFSGTMSSARATMVSSPSSSGSGGGGSSGGGFGGGGGGSW
ncbi:MAG: DUF2207 domain-containing protein [Gilvibacter sp.]